ncbi:hypothetical protein C5167_032290 [Papaver somniferum]|uniref:Fungal lipase-like domain-containing protein n=1 Tax=Papaver somniferum TaxID=3469 RepID=A0A4Y7K770_PAPSO|nr:hypothetical protein C5167_032290 [Papaver somniferum]
MSIICGLPILECVYCLACARWGYKRCLHAAGHESENWGIATVEEFEPVPPGGYGINPDCLILRKTYKDTCGGAPPYIIYVDHDNFDIVLAIRGLNLAKESDYAVLLDNKLGQRKFDGGYVHNGLLKAAGRVLEAECDILKELVEKYPNYTLTFTGHSLGSGVAALLAIVVVQNRDRLGDIDRHRVRCYAIAPARCMSLNLAVRYADIINSVVLQASFSILFLSSFGHHLEVLRFCMTDDFLPRTATPLEDIFKSLFWCMRDTWVPEERMLKDPRRLYAPGRLYHIVERKPFSLPQRNVKDSDDLSSLVMNAVLSDRLGRFPPVVRTAAPVDGRFEHIVLSCHATSDHAIIWIEKEAERALKLMSEKDKFMEIPAKQKMERQETLAREHTQEHKAALQRAITLAVSHAFAPSPYGTFDDDDGGSSSSARSGDKSSGSSKKNKPRESWDELIERLFEKDVSGRMQLKKSQV